MKTIPALLIAIPVSLFIGAIGAITVDDYNMSYSADYDKSVIQSSVRVCERLHKKECHFTSRYDYNIETLVWEVVPKP